MRRVLGCDVPSALWRRWQANLAPPVQPFFASETLIDTLPRLPRWTRAEFQAMRLPLTLHDTFSLHTVDAAAPWVLMLDETAFRRLPGPLRAHLLGEQRRAGRGGVQQICDWDGRLPPGVVRRLARNADDGLFLWWPGLWKSLPAAVGDTVLMDVLTRDRLSHQGDELTATHWQQIESRLPGVRLLAGTFAQESGANCFSSVLAAFGRLEVADLWLHRAPFERWLAGMQRSSELDRLGTVLVWRDAQDQLQHAAVSLGAGWAFQKDAQAWFTPRQIVSLRDLLARWDEPGWTVSASR